MSYDLLYYIFDKKEKDSKMWMVSFSKIWYTDNKCYYQLVKIGLEKEK